VRACAERGVKGERERGGREGRGERERESVQAYTARV